MSEELRKEFEESKGYIPVLYTNKTNGFTTYHDKYVEWLEMSNAALRADIQRVTRERDALKEAIRDVIDDRHITGAEEYVILSLTVEEYRNFAALAAVKPEEMKDLDPRAKDCVAEHFDELLEEKEEKPDVCVWKEDYENKEPVFILGCCDARLRISPEVYDMKCPWCGRPIEQKEV
jgi:hypothetical protein